VPDTGWTGGMKLLVGIVVVTFVVLVGSLVADLMG
jgi:hypothetical protein